MRPEKLKIEISPQKKKKPANGNQHLRVQTSETFSLFKPRVGQNIAFGYFVSYDAAAVVLRDI